MKVKVSKSEKKMKERWERHDIMLSSGLTYNMDRGVEDRGLGS